MIIMGKGDAVIESEICVVGPKDEFSKVVLLEPKKCGYVMICLEVEHCILPMGFLLWETAAKKRILCQIKEFANELTSEESGTKGLVEATVFKAMMIPPGEGQFLKMRPGVSKALFDVVMLIEFDTVDAARAFNATEICRTEIEKYEKNTDVKRVMVVVGSNARRMGPTGDVDHTRDGCFLFNYFFADTLEQNLNIWEYTAGWFKDQTGLDNSTLILPEPNTDVKKCPHTVINHCRWDGLKNVLPSLIFKRTFKTFVLANFDANKTAPKPILYSLA